MSRIKYVLHEDKSVTITDGVTAMTLTYADVRGLAGVTGLVDEIVELAVNRTSVIFKDIISGHIEQLDDTLLRMGVQVSAPAPDKDNEAFGGGAAPAVETSVRPWWRKLWRNH